MKCNDLLTLRSNSTSQNTINHRFFLSVQRCWIFVALSVTPFIRWSTVTCWLPSYRGQKLTHARRKEDKIMQDFRTIQSHTDISFTDGIKISTLALSNFISIENFSFLLIPKAEKIACSKNLLVYDFPYLNSEINPSHVLCCVATIFTNRLKLVMKNF